MDLKYTREELERTFNKRAWTPWTPTITASGGGGPTFTLGYAVYYLIGKICYIDVSITVTTAASASGRLDFTLPFTPQEATGAVLGCGREASATGDQMVLAHVVSGSGSMMKYNSATFPSWTNGAIGVVSGAFRVA